MTYFADLTPYKYSDRFYGSWPEPNTLNIGWLERDQPFPVGETPQVFQERLWQFGSGIINATRGIHFCTLCENSKIANNYNRNYRVGNAEIRVFYKDNVYAAPSTVYHYVVDHHYKPPEEFIEGVLFGYLPGTPQYRKLVKQLGVDYFFHKRKKI